MSLPKADLVVPSVRRAIQLAGLVAALAAAAACATSASLQSAREAERAQDYDQAVVEYSKALKERPNDALLRSQMEAARIRAAETHFARGRRLAGLTRFEEALVEFQLAAELNPGSADIDRAVRETRVSLRAKVAVTHEGRTQLETLVDQTRNLPPTGLDLPLADRLAESLIFRDASSRDVFVTVARLSGISLVFDPTFRESPVTVELHDVSLDQALTAVTSATRTFYRVTAPNTITIVPDTPAKRREYEEEVIRTFYLSNAELKETVDLLRVVVDNRRISPVTATNAITVKDTPERIAAAGKVISAIDKARAEVVIDVELLEVDRSRLKEYGLQIASPSSSTPDGISGSADVNREGFTLRDLFNLTQSDVILTGLPALYYRLLKTDAHTRTLANPQLRTTEGLPAQARFGERVPIPVTTFAPIATGGVNQQPITSFNYENIGVNIDITPRIHHDDNVSLTLRIEVSNISGEGFGGLPTFGNRQITTTIRLRDGETNMLAGLIRDEERQVLRGVPGLVDLPLVGKLFASNHTETQETDIILVLTPHIIRVLDLTEADLRPFRVGRDAVGSTIEFPSISPTPPAAPAPPPGDDNEPETLPLPKGGPAGAIKAPAKPGGGS
jgi:general secretion pathway protein D